MAIYRGIGGTGDSSNDATISAVTQQATNAAESAEESATSASQAATSAASASSSATAASTSATDAANSATAAAASASSIATSETNAANSADAANVSANDAATSEANAAASETAAAASAASASTSATAAANSATAASTSASGASTSEGNAAASETAAASSAAAAATSATTAAASESAAATSATNSATSATNSANSATASAGSATASATSASEAATSETNAAASESAAAASETAAAASESAAATSATNAAASQTAAASSASAAATSATNAAASETAASASESASAASASAANAAKDAALAALDSFDDRYLGDKATEPTVDNDGNPLVSGALYFNTTTEEMKVYSGSQWLNAYASLSGALLATNNLSDLNNVITARTNLGLGTAATTASTDYATAAQGALADSALQSYTVTEGDVTTHEAALTIAQSQVTGLSTALAGKVDDSQVLTNVPSGAVFTDTVYTHPTYAGDDINLDTGALSGATVISDLDFNVTTDTQGHVTDANATYSTRNLTASDVGALPITGGTLTGTLTVPSELTISESSPEIKFEDTDSNYDYWLHVNSNNFYILNDHDGNGAWDGTYPLQLEGDTDIGYIFGQRAFTDAYHPNADKWTTARTLSLTGDVTGSTSWDGSGNASITATVADDSHNHDHSDGGFTVNGRLDVTTGANIISTSSNPFRWQREALNETGQDDNVTVSLDDSNIYFTHNNDSDGDASGFRFRRMTGGSPQTVFEFDHNNIRYMGNLVWNAGNDGSGSGLDADLLDGQHASSFASASHSHSYLPLSGGTLTGTMYGTTVDLSSAVKIGSEVVLQESTDRSDLLQITSSTSGWGGLQIRNSSNEGRWSFMTNGETAGIYNDEDGQWQIYMQEGAYTRLYHAGSGRLETTSSGVSVTGSISATGNVTAYASDERLKENIKNIPDALEKIQKLNGVTYDWKDGCEDIGFIPAVKTETGVIAQNIQAVIPDAVCEAPFNSIATERTGVDNHYLTVDKEKIIPLLIEAIKELKAEVDELKGAK